MTFYIPLFTNWVFSIWGCFKSRENLLLSLSSGWLAPCLSTVWM